MRSKPEKKEEKEKVRVALLSATLRLAAAHGFASVGLREVSREAGIAPTSFYRHFADMEDVGRALVDELVSRVVQRCVARGEEGAAEAIVAELFEVIAEEPALVRFIIAERVGAFPPIRAGLKKQLAQLTAGLQKVFERTLPRGASAAAPYGAELASLLLLDGANAALDVDTEALPQVRERVRAQLRGLAKLIALAPESVP